MGYMTDERRMIQETARAFALKEVDRKSVV